MAVVPTWIKIPLNANSEHDVHGNPRSNETVWVVPN
jgi:hypothetical protein